MKNKLDALTGTFTWTFVPYPTQDDVVFVNKYTTLSDM